MQPGKAAIDVNSDNRSCVPKVVASMIRTIRFEFARKSYVSVSGSSNSESKIDVG